MSRVIIHFKSASLLIFTLSRKGEKLMIKCLSIYTIICCSVCSSRHCIAINICGWKVCRLLLLCSIIQGLLKFDESFKFPALSKLKIQVLQDYTIAFDIDVQSKL